MEQCTGVSSDNQGGADRSQEVPFHPVITPLSPHSGHMYTIDPASGRRYASISPKHLCRPGFRRQVMFVRSGVDAWRMVTHPTTERRKMGMAVAGPGISASSRSSFKKCNALVYHVPVMRAAPGIGGAISDYLLESSQLRRAFQVKAASREYVSLLGAGCSS